MRCAVFGCNSSNQSKKSPCPGIKFYHFPKNEELSRRWLYLTGRKDPINTKTASICSKHFLEQDYKENLQHKLLNYCPKRYRGLKDDAIPSQNLTLSSRTSATRNDAKLSRKAISEKRERKRLVEAALLDNSKMDSKGIDHLVEEVEVATSSNIAVVDTQKGVSSIDVGIQVGSRANLEQMEKTLSAVEKLFSKNQLAKLRNKKRIKWSIDEISNAIALYSAGSRAYRLMLKKGYPFPAVSTLRSWLRKIKLDRGIIKNVFRLLEHARLSVKDKVCTLLFDEMKIRKEYIYDRSKHETLPPYSYVQTVIMSGLFKPWKQPIFYEYDFQMTAEKILDIIKYVEGFGFTVVAITSDLGGGNRGLHNELKVSYTEPYFTNPVNGEKIFVFADVPHLLKLIRNHFVDQGFIVDGKEINKSIIESMLECTSVSDLKITHKITKEKLNVRGAQRQRVKYAAKLFSHTISKAISRCGTLGYLATDTNWLECADFFKLVNDWFDVFNVSIPISDSRNRNRAYGLAKIDQDLILSNMTNMVSDMRVKGRKQLLPFQKGILMSNRALKLMFEDLQRRFSIDYILTRRINQDVLENFFGVIRAKGGLHDHPNALEFKYRLRSYLIGKNEGAFSDFSNVEADDTPDLPISASIVNTLTTPDKTAINEDETPNETEFHELAFDGLQNLAGFISHKLRTANEDLHQSDSTWVDHVNEGGLSKPSQKFMREIEQLNLIFLEANGNDLYIGENYLKKLMDKAAEVACIEKAKKLFFTSRLYFRIRELNRGFANCKLRKRKVLKTVT